MPNGGSARKKKHFQVNGELVAFYRNQKNWTQETLSGESGLSVRVISKAEKGGSLEWNTISSLANALSSPTQKVHPDDLITDPRALAAKVFSQLCQVRRKCRGEKPRYHF